MKTEEFCICEACKKPILKEEDGKIIQGNVYVAHPVNRGGLIGNAFVDADRLGSIEVRDILAYCYCNNCLKDILFHDTEKETQ